MFAYLRMSLVIALVAGVGGAMVGRAGETPRPGKLTKAEQAALQPGLTLRLYGKDGVLDARRVRLAALHVGEGAAPTPFVDAGAITAKLNGYIKTSLKGEFTFRIACIGSARLHINGKDVLKAENHTVDTPAPIVLAKGYNRIDIDYTSGTRVASLRVYWSSDTFTTEPLPPDVLVTRGDEPDLVRGEERRRGRMLYATLGCSRCHALPDGTKENALAMPEIRSQRAPSLEGIGQRLTYGWMKGWILEPRSFRPEARMPQLLHGELATSQAEIIAGYLTTLKNGPALPASASTKELIDEGERHFDKLGCVACHHLDDPKKGDQRGRLSLFFVKAKFKPGALESFLKSPNQHYPWIRMPDFQLNAREASSLTAFLLDRAKGIILVPLTSFVDVAEGPKLFREAGCANCHASKQGERTQISRCPRPATDALSNGCLARAPARAPDFGLTQEQRASLQAFLKLDGKSLGRETPAEFSLRQVKELQCQACHRRDGQQSRWNQILEDDGLMSEFLPSLTWAGEKLKPAWTANLLAGQHRRRARPWLKARMPAFPARAELLALGLSHEHGLALGEDDRPAPDARLAAIGQKLIEQQGGFNCIMCHAVGARAAVAPFEAPGINLRDAAERLRHNYYPRWMIDPPHVDITTRMSKFSQDGKTTPLRDFFDGDAFRQYDAVWHYMQTLPAK